MGVQRLVYTSSTSAYGRSLVPNENEAVWVDECLEPDPLDIYDERSGRRENRDRVDHSRHCVTDGVRCFPESLETTAAYRLYRGVDVQDVGMAHGLALENDHVVGTFERLVRTRRSNPQMPLVVGRRPIARPRTPPLGSADLRRERMAAAATDRPGLP